MALVSSIKYAPTPYIQYLDLATKSTQITSLIKPIELNQSLYSFNHLITSAPIRPKSRIVNSCSKGFVQHCPKTGNKDTDPGPTA